jgi:hypothetical protein
MLRVLRAPELSLDNLCQLSANRVLVNPDANRASSGIPGQSRRRVSGSAHEPAVTGHSPRTPAEAQTRRSDHSAEQPTQRLTAPAVGPSTGRHGLKTPHGKPQWGWQPTRVPVHNCCDSAVGLNCHWVISGNFLQTPAQLGQVAIPLQPADAAPAVGGADRCPGPREQADPPIGCGQTHGRVPGDVDGGDHIARCEAQLRRYR